MCSSDLHSDVSIHIQRRNLTWHQSFTIMRRNAKGPTSVGPFVVTLREKTASMPYGFAALGSEENFFSVSVPWHPTPSPHT